jgi:hypothetical protein
MAPSEKSMLVLVICTNGLEDDMTPYLLVEVTANEVLLSTMIAVRPSNLRGIISFWHY